MNLKKVLLIVVLVFVGFWMFTDPNGLAEAARAFVSKVWELATQLFEAIIRFFGALA